MSAHHFSWHLTWHWWSNNSWSSQHHFDFWYFIWNITNPKIKHSIISIITAMRTVVWRTLTYLQKLLTCIIKIVVKTSLFDFFLFISQKNVNIMLYLKLHWEKSSTDPTVFFWNYFWIFICCLISIPNSIQFEG